MTLYPDPKQSKRKGQCMLPYLYITLANTEQYIIWNIHVWIHTEIHPNSSALALHPSDRKREKGSPIHCPNNKRECTALHWV